MDFMKLIAHILLLMHMYCGMGHAFEPCSFWAGSSYFRGTCWKILEETTSWSDAQNACTQDHQDAQIATITDDVIIWRFVQSLPIAAGKDPIVWAEGYNNSLQQPTTTNSSGTLITQPATCRAIYLTANQPQTLTVYCKTNDTALPICVLEVGNPCDDLDGVSGDVFQTSCHYYHDQNTKTWSDAKIECESKGAYLAELSSPEEEMFLFFVTSRYLNASQFSVGARKDVTSGEYTWIHADYNVLSDVTGSDDCVTMVTNSNTSALKPAYQSVQCSSYAFPFVCEKDLPLTEFLVAIPAPITNATTTTDKIQAFITLTTTDTQSTQAISMATITIYTSGTIPNIITTMPVYSSKRNIYEIDKDTLSSLFITENGQPQNKSIVISSINKNLDVSLILYENSTTTTTTSTTNETNSSPSSQAVTPRISTHVKIFPLLFLDIYYVITTSPTTMSKDETKQKSFILIIATGKTKTSTTNKDGGGLELTNLEVYFPRRYFDITMNFDLLDITNIGLIEVSLSPLESVMFESEADLTGSAIISDRPIAVFAGNRRTKLLDSCCSNFVMTQSAPFQHIGTVYVAMVIENGLYRIMATRQATTVNIYDEDESTSSIPTTTTDPIQTFTLNQVASTKDITLTKGQLVSITSDHHLIVTYLGPYDEESHSTQIPDLTKPSQQPCLMPIPSLNLYRKSNFTFDINTMLLPDWTEIRVSVIIFIDNDRNSESEDNVDNSNVFNNISTDYIKINEKYVSDLIFSENNASISDNNANNNNITNSNNSDSNNSNSNDSNENITFSNVEYHGKSQYQSVVFSLRNNNNNINNNNFQNSDQDSSFSGGFMIEPLYSYVSFILNIQWSIDRNLFCRVVGLNTDLEIKREEEVDDKEEEEITTTTTAATTTFTTAATTTTTATTTTATTDITQNNNTHINITNESNNNRTTDANNNITSTTTTTTTTSNISNYTTINTTEPTTNNNNTLSTTTETIPNNVTDLTTEITTKTTITTSKTPSTTTTTTTPPTTTPTTTVTTTTTATESTNITEIILLPQDFQTFTQQYRSAIFKAGISSPNSNISDSTSGVSGSTSSATSSTGFYCPSTNSVSTATSSGSSNNANTQTQTTYTTTNNNIGNNNNNNNDATTIITTAISLDDDSSKSTTSQTITSPLSSSPPTPSACVTAIVSTLNVSEAELEDIVKDIQKKLFVNPRKVSAFTRKLISASDPRPSSTTMGVFGVTIFSVTFVSLMLPDIITVSLHLYRGFINFKHTYYG